MKRLTLVAVAVMAMACGDKSGPTESVGAGSVTATIDGAAFSGSLSVQATRTSNVLSIGAVSNNSRQINFALFGVTTTGTVPVGAGAASTITYTDVTKAWVTSLVGGTGSVTITTLTANRAVGTFSFTAIPSANTGATGNKVVTNGSFDVKF